MEIFLIMIATVTLTALLSLTGGVMLLYGRGKFVKFLQKIGPVIAFVVLLYAVFGDMIPEVLESGSLPNIAVLLLVVAGFVVAWLVGAVMGKFHHHNDVHHHDKEDPDDIETHGDKEIKNKAQAYTMLAVDSVHGIADGIVMGTSFLANPAAGFSTCLATVAHEIPQEIGDFSIMQRAKLGNGRILKMETLSGLIIVPAAAVAYLVGNSLLSYLPGVLAVAAGFLLYVAFGELVCIIESIKSRLPKQLKK